MLSPLAVSVEQVTYRYSGQSDVTALDGVSVDFPSGEISAITGPSGSGKSTILNLMGLLDRPSQGEVLIAGQKTSTLSSGELCALRSRHIGFVFQSFHLLPTHRALDNVALPLVYARESLRGRRERAWDALDRVGLGDLSDRFPSQLSGGQQQRVAIARALVASPRVLLCDEPTGNLDSRTSNTILGLLAGLADDGIAIVVVTHDAQVASSAARQVQLVDGQVAGGSGHAEPKL